MRFAIVFAGYMLALSIDAPLLYDHLGFFFIAIVMVAMLYLDMASMSLDRIEDLKKIVAEYKKTKTGETQNNDKKNPPPPAPTNPA